MIGYSADETLDCLVETELPLGEDLLASLVAASALTTLDLSISYDAWGSDHASYLEQGMPAAMSIENDYTSYPCYHRGCDLPAYTSSDMGPQILTMNLVAAAELVGVLDVIFADGFESGDLSAWSP